MNDATPTAGSRISRLKLVRAVYILVAVGFAIWGLRRHGQALVGALSATEPLEILRSSAFVLVGLVLTFVVWRKVLFSFGSRMAVGPARKVFFVGRLGKYIPGSVWAIGAQADLARDYRVAPRTTAATGLIFLWLHMATAVAVVAVAVGSEPAPLSRVWARTIGIALAGVGISPGFLMRIAPLISGSARGAFAWRWRDSGLIALLMLAVWALYGGAALLALPSGALDASGGLPLALAAGAFAAAYVVGAVAVFAPAGLGVREVVFVALLAPTVGAPAAAACALLTRAIHTLCDFTLAGVAWMANRTKTRTSHERLPLDE